MAVTNEELVKRIKAGEDVAENMEQLYQQVKQFIHSVAWRYRDSGELEDLEQEGYLALYEAYDRTAEAKEYILFAAISSRRQESHGYRDGRSTEKRSPCGAIKQSTVKGCEIATEEG